MFRCSNSLYGNMRTRKFSDVFQTSDAFVQKFQEIGFDLNVMQDGTNTLQLIWLLLIGKYANSTIANSDENQFTVQLMSKVWQYGPTWEKRVDIQKKLRELSLDDGSDIFKGSEAIYNTALNPSTEISDPEENNGKLKFINSQNTTQYRKSKLEGLAYLNSLLETDVTESFLLKFKDLFRVIVQREEPLWYITNYIKQ